MTARRPGLSPDPGAGPPASPTTAPAVELVDIRKQYGVTVVLDGVSLTCAPGRVHALVGENGAGKSTLLKILSGGVRPDGGRLRLAGGEVDLGQLSPHRAQELGISVVHQEFALVPSMTVAENVFLGHEPRRRGQLDRRRMREETASALETLASRLSPDERVENLSLADAQVVEVAKALSQDARVVALDEPSAVLSGDELQTLFRVVRGLRDAGVAILYVSHRMDELFSLCDDYSVLKDGRVAGAGAIAETDRDEIVRRMVGRDVASAFPASSVPPGPVRLQVSGLLVPGLREPVDLQVRAGEVVGLAGLGGSGRTRLAKGIFGAHKAVGEVLVDGKPVGPFRSSRDAMRAGVAYLPEDRKQAGLALTKSVAANLTLLTLGSLRSRGLLSRRREGEQAGSLVDRFTIRTSRQGGDVSGGLSGGNQQKVVFAKWLESRPRVVILDEPTRGIDVGSKEQIYQLVRELAADGVAFLLISSELVEVLGLSDRIIVLADGRVVGQLDAGATEEDVMRCITATSQRPVPETAT